MTRLALLILFAIGLLVIVALIVLGQLRGLETAPVEQAVRSEAGTRADGDSLVPTASATVVYTDEGFEPTSVAVIRGGAVTFVNESTRAFWPASSFHPTHLVYPEKGGSCGTSTFDACGDIAPGTSVSFTFNEVGSWDYHDHLRASKTGTVTVTK